MENKLTTNQDDDVIEVCELLSDQKKLLWRIHHTATEPPGKIMAKADLANFLLCHALHIHEMAKAALVLMQGREPYAVVLLGRAALESAFNLVAAKRDKKFGPQRMAYELEDLARKLALLTEKGVWPKSRHPTPEECRKKADWIRKEYIAPVLSDKRDRVRIEKIEHIAKVAELSPYYDEDYRQLSLTVHSNQSGIINAGSGFLVRKGMLAVCNATMLASATLCDVFHIREEFDATIQGQYGQLKSLMQKPDSPPLRESGVDQN
jgi:hypothetical protein